MARVYSLDQRERVVASVARGESCRMVAALFDVSVASVATQSQRARVAGSTAQNRWVIRRLIPLPPYSSDLNPIEQVVAKIKTLLRKAEERTTDAVSTRIGNLLEAFTPKTSAPATSPTPDALRSSAESL